MVSGGDGMTGRWCVLRTSGAKTLPLAHSLATAGFGVWTPIEHQSRRRPRSRETAPYEAPLLPTFVFARAHHLPDLVRCISLASSQHPPFSIFHYFGRIPLLADADMADLRVVEEGGKRAAELARLRLERRSFPDGQRVRVSADEGGAFAGMTGIVQNGDHKFARIEFSRGFKVKIATFLLSLDDVTSAPPRDGIAAQAA